MPVPIDCIVNDLSLPACAQLEGRCLTDDRIGKSSQWVRYAGKRHIVTLGKCSKRMLQACACTLQSRHSQLGCLGCQGHEHAGSWVKCSSVLYPARRGPPCCGYTCSYTRGMYATLQVCHKHHNCPAIASEKAGSNSIWNLSLGSRSLYFWADSVIQCRSRKHTKVVRLCRLLCRDSVDVQCGPGRYTTTERSRIE